MSTLRAVLLLAVTVAWSATARAGSIDYLSNQSADYMRTFSRNASVDPDAVAYNPAGTAWMKDGLHLSLHGQTLFKDYSITYQGKDYTADDPTPILPSFFAIYKWKHLAAFAAFTVPAGGGSLTYEDGVPYLIPLATAAGGRAPPLDAKFEGSSLFLAGTAGAAYELFDLVSLSAAVRVMSATKTYKGFGTYRVLYPPESEETVTGRLDTEKTAVGVGGIFGVHVRPLPALDIALRYETETPLEFETSTDSENLAFIGALTTFADGAKEKKNLPALLGIGIDYDILTQLTFSTSFNYYFIKAADDGADVAGASPYVVGYDDDYADGIEWGLSLAYRVVPWLWVSAGYNRTWSGGDEKTFYDFEYPLNSNSVGAGVRASLLDDRLGLVFALSTTLYEESENEGLQEGLEPETFDKQVISVALAAEYRLF